MDGIILFGILYYRPLTLVLDDNCNLERMIKAVVDIYFIGWVDLSSWNEESCLIPHVMVVVLLNIILPIMVVLLIT